MTAQRAKKRRKLDPFAGDLRRLRAAIVDQDSWRGAQHVDDYPAWNEQKRAATASLKLLHGTASLVLEYHSTAGDLLNLIDADLRANRETLLTGPAVLRITNRLRELRVKVCEIAA